MESRGLYVHPSVYLLHQLLSTPYVPEINDMTPFSRKLQGDQTHKKDGKGFGVD